MNLKTSIRYHLKDTSAAIMIYYTVVVCINLFFILASTILKTTDSSMSGMEFSSAIFLFILGLNSFKETFGMFLQNSISRKTMFTSKMTAFILIAMFMTIIDRIILIFGSMVTTLNPNSHYIGLFSLLYEPHVKSVSSIQSTIEGLLLVFFLYLTCITIGFFITIAYYRMNKAVKLIVSVGTPITVFVVIPMIDTSITRGRITKTFVDIVEGIFGYGMNPFAGILTTILTFIFFSMFSWLLMRKAILSN